MRTKHAILLSIILWATLTSAGALIHAIAWSPAGDDPAANSFFGERLCKTIANISQLLTLPGWVVTWLGLGWFESGWAAAVAGGIGWACLISLVWFVVGARQAIRRRLARRSHHPLAPRTQTTSPSVPPRAAAVGRRAFLLDSSLVSATLLGGGVAAHATLVGPWSIATRRYRVPIRGLPRTLDGLRIVQVSDTHLGPRIPRSHIEHAVRRALALTPDLVVLTGDYVHMGKAHIAPAAELFIPLTRPGASRLGVLGVLGNHDFYADGPAMARALRAIGVRMIDNDRVFLDASATRLTTEVPDNPGLCIAGLGDLLEDRVDPVRALREVPADMPRVVLAHNPDTAEAPVVTGVAHTKFYPSQPPEPGWPASRIDLMLSGHTHGGQIRLPFLGAPAVPSRFRQKYAHGLVQGPVCPVLVSAGIGMSVLPVRLGVPPEVVEITLVSRDAASDTA
ncbi:MAG: metallophosphoesterase [Phycisphaerales bacterium]